MNSSECVTLLKMCHIVHVVLALPHTVFPAPCTPRTEQHRREAELGCEDSLISPTSASASRQQQRTFLWGPWCSQSPSVCPSRSLSGEVMPCFLPSFLITTVTEIFACPDVNFSPVLVNYWIWFHNNPDHCGTDLYLLLHSNLR